MVNNRFQISCKICGILSVHKTLDAAQRQIQYILPAHSDEGESIEIFDVMAHIGRAEIYSSNGEVLKYRKA